MTVHTFCAGQLVGATSPLNDATIWPSELRKLAPATWIPAPAGALIGLNEEITGAPPGDAGGAVVDVVAAEEPGRWPAAGACGCSGEPPWLGDATPDEGGAACCPLLPDDSASAIAPMTTRVAATATDTISHGSS